MTLKITHKHGTTASTPPAASDIDVGELAINAADVEIYTKDTSGAVQAVKSYFTQSGLGAIRRPVELKLEDIVSILDFIPATEYANIKNGTSTYDTSAAFRAAFAVSQGVYVPSGQYYFSGASITTIKQSDTPQANNETVFHLFGDGAANSRIKFTNTSTFMEIGSIRGCHVHDLSFYDFQHGFKFTGTGINVANRKMWEYCVFEGYVGCAISQQQEDSPYWSVENCTFKADLNSNTSIGVALGSAPNLSTIRDNAFTRNRVHLKLGGGGVDVLVEHNDFLQFSKAGDDARVSIFVYTDTAKGKGQGLNVFSNKFGNENKRGVSDAKPGDFYVVYADQQAGTFNGDKFPNLTTNAAGTKRFSNSQFNNNKIQGGGGYGSTPFIFSTTNNMSDFTLSGNNVVTVNAITYWVEFLTVSTTLTGFSHRWFFGALTGTDAGNIDVAPQFSNQILNLEVFSTDTGSEIWTQKHSPNPLLGANRAGYYMVSNTAATSFTVGGGASKSTAITDATGGTNAATFDLGAGIAYPVISTANMPGGSNNSGEAGDPLWLHFDLKQSSADHMLKIAVSLRKTGNGSRQWSRIISVPKNWTTFRFPVFIRDETLNMILEFTEPSVASNGGDNVDIGRFSLYSSKDCTPQGQVTFDSVKADSIALGGTVAANQLSLYEEGTFDPTIELSTSGSVTPTNQEGYYTIVGNLVTINLFVDTSAISSPAGDVSIGGLPAAIALQTTGTAPQFYGRGKISDSNFNGSVTNGNKAIYVLGNGDAPEGVNSLQLWKDADFTTRLQGSDLRTGTNKNRLRLSLTYRTN